VKKTKRKTAIRRDDSGPSKPAVPPAGRAGTPDAAVQIPTYKGLSKTAEMPKPTQARAGEQAKPPFERTAARRRRGSSTEVDFGEQQARQTRGGGRSATPREQYIRLRIRVSHGQLSVVDSHLVDGPLGQVVGFPGDFAYEVTLGDRLLHAGALPDLGVQRSFANPNGPPEQHGHYISERSVYEFAARLPADEVTPETIGQIAVRLHRVKEEARTDRLGEMPLGVRFEREMRPVAEIVGLPDSTLPEAIEQRGGRTPNV
jgi:hypothetical protein